MAERELPIIPPTDDDGAPPEAYSPKFVRLMRDFHAVVNYIEAHMLSVIEHPDDLSARLGALEAFRMSRGLMADAMRRACPTGAADIGLVATGIVRMLGPIHRASRTHLSLPEAPVWVPLDEQVLRRVVLNLFVNALEASPPDGRVIVEVTRMGDTAAIAFDDAGSGPGIIARSGIGLAYLEQIAVQAGGRLSLETSQRGGSRVTVALPVVPAPLDRARI